VKKQIWETKFFLLLRLNSIDLVNGKDVIVEIARDGQESLFLALDITAQNYFPEVSSNQKIEKLGRCLAAMDGTWNYPSRVRYYQYDIYNVSSKFLSMEDLSPMKDFRMRDFAHLSPEEAGMLLRGEKNESAEEHARVCPACASQVEEAKKEKDNESQE